MQESRLLLFAEHNEEACNYLNNSGNFVDWVITTAFYSAIHYIHHKIFPYTYIFPNGKKKVFYDFETFSQQFKGAKQSKHILLKNFVEMNHNEIAIDFQHLMDTCMTARYNDYHFDSVAAKIARMRLKNIKKYCIKKEA